MIEDIVCEFKAVLNPENPVKWAKTIVGFANGDGGLLFIGVSNDREAFGISLDEVDQTKNLIALVNNRHIFPHVRYSYMLRSADMDAERFVLVLKVSPSESVVRYREGDFNEIVYVKGDGNSTPATPEEIKQVRKHYFGMNNRQRRTFWADFLWSLVNCKEFIYQF